MTIKNKHPLSVPEVRQQFTEWLNSVQYVEKVDLDEEPAYSDLEFEDSANPEDADKLARLQTVLKSLDGAAAGSNEFLDGVELAIDVVYDMLKDETDDELHEMLTKTLNQLELFAGMNWGFGEDPNAEPAPQIGGDEFTIEAMGEVDSYDGKHNQLVMTRRQQRLGVLLASSPDVKMPDRWEGILGFEGVMTGDGRIIEVGALRWDEDSTIPLRYVKTDFGAHDGAVVAGVIERIERRPQEDGTAQIWGTGPWDLGSETGLEAQRVVFNEIFNGVSLDLDDVSFEVRVSEERQKQAEGKGETQLSEDGSKTVMKGKPGDEITSTSDARIRAATIVAIPAFAGAKIYAVKGDQMVEDPETTATEPPSEEEVVAKDFAIEPVNGFHTKPGVVDKVIAVIAEDRLEDLPDEDFEWTTLESLYFKGEATTEFKKKKRRNWVEKAGGLPKYIKRISKHLRKKGMTEGHAIATAVNVVKKMCATGDVNYPGKQNVNAKSRAEACAAVAQWEAMKIKSKASSADSDAFRGRASK